MHQRKPSICAPSYQEKSLTFIIIHGLIKMIKNLTEDIYEHECYLEKHKDDTKVVLWTSENLLDPARHLYSVGKCVPVDQRNLKT